MNMIVRNCCPKCGAKIIVSFLYQYSLDYTINKNGELSKRYKKSRGGSMECGIASCESSCGTFWEDGDFLIDEYNRFIDLKYE